MPSDKLENLFREKAEEVQHTPPPQFNWTPEKSWDKLQSMLPEKQRKLSSGFYMGVAAGLVLMLVAGIVFYKISANLKTPALSTTVASEPARSETATGNLNLERPMDDLVKDSSVGVPKINTSNVSHSRKVYLVTKGVRPKKPQTLGKQTLPPVEEPQEEKAQASESKLMAITDVSDESTPSIKVTVVLGGKTLARSQNPAIALEPVLISSEKKKKLKKDKMRLRIHNLDADFSKDNQIATNKSSTPEIGLSTRIKF